MPQDFKGLVASLAAGAATALSQIESDQAEGGATEEVSAEERTERRRVGLATARQLIDTMAMLEHKTEGNLTDEERAFLGSALTQLRVTYVRSSAPGAT
jgi:hypothetical protein